MAVNKITPVEGVNISLQAIALVVGNAAIECYGVVGLSAVNSNKDKVDNLLGRENYHEGIECIKSKRGYEINIYIFVANDVKITEVSREVQKKVKYVLEKTFAIKFSKVNVFVQGTREIK